MAATQFAADTPLLVTGLIATAGIFSLWRLWIYALAFLLLGFVLSAGWRRARVLTDAEWAELRYGGRAGLWLRGVKALYFGTFFNCVVLAMVLWAAKEIAEPFLTWHRWLPEAVFEPVRGLVEWVGVPFTRVTAPEAEVWRRSADNLLSMLMLAALTSAYSTTGGLRAVVRTDLVQFAIMMVATALYAGYALAEVGGREALHTALGALEPIGGVGGLSRSELLATTPDRARGAGLAVLAVFGLQWLVQMNADGTGYLAQRTMACRSDRDARWACVLFAFLQVLLRSLLWIPIALCLLVLFPPDTLGAASFQAEREATFVRGIAELLPAGAKGLLFTAMLAALASTVDTHLNWGASYWTNDLYRRLICEVWQRRTPAPASLVFVARASNLAILAIALAIMTQLNSIQFAWTVSLLFGAGMGVMLVLRWLWWRINGWGELAAIAASSLLAPVLLYTWPEEQEALRLLAMAAGATAVGVVVALLTPAEPPERLRAFFERVRPPGWWGFPGHDVQSAAAARRRFGREILAVAAAALSLFCLLTALVTWWALSPPPAFLPSRTMWVGSLLVVGAALTPVWWWLGFRFPLP